MKKQKDYREELGVDDDASTRTIHSMYAGLAAVYSSPGMAESPEARAKFAEIEEAYHFLIENRPVKPDLRSKHVAVLSADVSGFCRLVCANEKDALKFLQVCLAVFRDVVPKFNGRIFNTAGDAVLAEFANVSDAVRCAVAVQADLRDLNASRPVEKQMLFRMGVHAGNVFFHEGGDLLGETVNLAARLQTSCTPGGISISKDVYGLANREVTASFSDLGEVTFRNQSKPVRVFHAAAPSEIEEATRAQEYTRKTSYMMSDLEKTVATPTKSRPKVATPEPAAAPAEAVAAPLEPAPPKAEPAPQPRRPNAVTPVQADRLQLLKWAIPATVLALLLVVVLGFQGAKQEAAPAEQRAPAEAAKPAGFQVSKADVEQALEKSRASGPMDEVPMPAQPEPAAAANPRAEPARDVKPLYTMLIDSTLFEAEGLNPATNDLTCIPGQHLGLLHLYTAENTLEPPAERQDPFPGNICQRTEEVLRRTQAMRASAQYGLAAAQSAEFSVPVQLSGEAESTSGFAAPVNQANQCPAGLKRLELFVANVIRPPAKYGASNVPENFASALFGDTKPAPVTLVRQDPGQPCDETGSCAGVTYGQPKLVTSFEYKGSGQYICAIPLQ